MHIALVCNIHGNLHALEAVAADIRRRVMDQMLCLGDHPCCPLLPRETAQWLMASGWHCRQQAVPYGRPEWARALLTGRVA